MRPIKLGKGMCQNLSYLVLFLSKLFQLIKPLVGPVVRELNKEVLIDNRFLIFEIVKHAIFNFLYGLGNFIYDTCVALFTSTWSDWMPGK